MAKKNSGQPSHTPDNRAAEYARIVTERALADVFPPGLVIAFAGIVEGDSLDQNPPQLVQPVTGWFLCNGALVPRRTWEDLFRAIQYAHGGSGDFFRLPDYRGYFLRGVDRGRNVDREARERISPLQAPNEGNDGNRVGSIQHPTTGRPHNRAFGVQRVDDHIHNLPKVAAWANGEPKRGGFVVDVRGGFEPGEQSMASGGHTHSIVDFDYETRPVNAYVNYLIKAR